MIEILLEFHEQTPDGVDRAQHILGIFDGFVLQGEKAGELFLVEFFDACFYVL